MDNFDLRKFVSEKTLLNENAPGYDTRKTGEALPTLESVKAAYEAENDIKEDASKAKELSDRVLTVASEGIKDLNGTELMEFRALIAQAFDMEDEAEKSNKLNEISFDAIDRMEGLANIQDLKTMKDMLRILSTGWMQDGFGKWDIAEYMSHLVNKI
jgi:hypothetical protein